MKPLILPTVNFNGTSKYDLICQMTRVSNALHNALDVMGQTMPHSRDYQTGFTANVAREAWRERMQMIKALKDEVGRYAFSIGEQVDRNVTHAPGFKLWAVGVGENDAPDEP